MSKIGLIIKREYTSRVKKRSFIIMTLLVPILSAAFLIGAFIIGMPEDKDLKILIIDDAGVLSYGIFKKQHEYKNSPKKPNGKFDDPDAHLNEKYSFFLYDEKGKGVDDAKVDFVENPKYKECDLIISFSNSEETDQGKLYPTVKVFYKEPPSSVVQNQLNQAINESVELAKLEENGIDESTYKSIKTKMDVDFIDYRKEKESNIDKKAIIGFAFGLMIYMFIFMYGVQVMKGVIEEKTSRIVEVIVSSVKPFELMMGKIIGIMFVGLTQFIMWIVLIGIASTVIVPFVLPDNYSSAFQATELANKQMTPEVLEKMGTSPTQFVMQDNEMIDFLYNEVPWTSLIFIFLFFFIGGYLLYGSLMAAIGAAVDSETDTQQFMLPVTLPLIFAYIISILGIQDPNSTIMAWCSEIPFTSPVVMLVRYSALSGEGLGWQLLLSMVLLIITFIGTTWVASKIYRTGILMYGKKITYRELFKWLRY